MSKPWYKSKTLLFNIALILGGLYLPSIAETSRTLLISTGIANIVLRLRTKYKISFKKQGLKL